MAGVQDFFVHYPELLTQYSHFWLVEDDLFIPEQTAILIKSFAKIRGFSLFAPQISGDSYFNHCISVNNPGFLFRVVDFVEQMSPVFSRDLFKKCLPSFNENYSGWGFEWLWQKYVAESDCFTAALDCAVIYHTREGGKGTLYKNAPPGTLPPKQEMDALLEKYGLNTSSANFAAVVHNAQVCQKIVSGMELIEQGVKGYRYLSSVDRNMYRRCIEFLVGNTLQADPTIISLVIRFLESLVESQEFKRFLEIAN